MSNNKQYGSVEWLYHKIVIKLCNDLQTIKYAHLFKEELEQAKAMHKEECVNLLNTHNDIFDSSEDHYKQTFGE